jgi:hypothetical protein
MLHWVDTQLRTGTIGRRVPLLLVGLPRTGKTQWAITAGPRPAVYPGVNRYDPKASHLVLNDVDFSCSQSWREALGFVDEPLLGQDARDGVDERLALPLIVTCSPGRDPRRVPVLRKHIERGGCVVVDVDEPLWVL